MWGSLRPTSPSYLEFPILSVGRVWIFSCQELHIKRLGKTSVLKGLANKYFNCFLQVLAFREQKLEALKLQAAIAAKQQEEEEEQLRAAEEKERKRRDHQHKQVRHLTTVTYY